MGGALRVTPTLACSQLLIGVPLSRTDRAIESINPPVAAAIKEILSFTVILNLSSNLMSLTEERQEAGGRGQKVRAF
jgi:hypothetical protein